MYRRWIVTSKEHHIKTHCLPDCKSRGKLQEKGVRIPGTGSVFLYGDSLVGECSRWLWAQVQILFTVLLYKNTLFAWTIARHNYPDWSVCFYIVSLGLLQNATQDALTRSKGSALLGVCMSKSRAGSIKSVCD